MKSWGVIGAAFAIWFGVGVTLVVIAQAGTPAAGAPQNPGGGGGGRGPSPGSLIWNSKCAGCHTAGGRAPNLFEESWLSKTDDVQMSATIKNGKPGTEMPAFGSALSDLQIFQLTQHVRTATATANPAPAFVAIVRSRWPDSPYLAALDGRPNTDTLAIAADTLLRRAWDHAIVIYADSATSRDQILQTDPPLLGAVDRTMSNGLRNGAEPFPRDAF